MCSICYEHCISYLRYGITWGDWHGGHGGFNGWGESTTTTYGPFEIVLIGANGIVDDGYVSAIVFWGNDGTNYGPFGGSGGEAWATTFNSTFGKASFFCHLKAFNKSFISSTK